VRQDAADGTVLVVEGLDLLDGTPLLDIKPYLPYADAHPEATNGFAEKFRQFQMPVEFPPELLMRIPEDEREPLLAVLAQDPRAAYNKKPDYVYGMAYGDFDVRFTVENGTLFVCGVEKRDGMRRVKGEQQKYREGIGKHRIGHDLCVDNSYERN